METKYLGQIIDSSGKPVFTLKENAFSKLFMLMNKEMTKCARIRMFTIYIRNKISHLLPLLCIDKEQIILTWKFIRRIIFKKILICDTTPKESLGLLKLGYYEIIIRPLLKLLNGEYYSKYYEEANLLKEVIIKTLKTWPEAEENLDEEIKKIIYESITDNNVKLSIKQFDEIRLETSWKRITKGALGLTSKLKVLLPSTLAFLSNAKIHMVESLLKTEYIDEIKKKSNRMKALKILRKYTDCIEYIENNANQVERVTSDEWTSQIEEDLIIEVEIIERLKSHKYANEYSNTYLVNIENEIRIGERPTNNNKFLSKCGFDILELFRKYINIANSTTLYDVERILDFNDQNDIDMEGKNNINNNNSNNIRKLGRPQKNVNININNNTIEKYFK